MEFSREKWMDDCRLFAKNRQGLGFQVMFHYGKDKNGEWKGMLNFSKDLNPKYKPALSMVAFAIIRGSYIVFKDMVFPVAYAKEEDRKAQAALHTAECTKNVAAYINVLLNEGVDKAMDVFSAKQALIQFAYEAGHMSYANGQWKSPCGDLYTDGVFVDRNTGQPYYSYYSSVWDILLTDGPVSMESGMA